MCAAKPTTEGHSLSQIGGLVGLSISTFLCCTRRLVEGSGLNCHWHYLTSLRRLACLLHPRQAHLVVGLSPGGRIGSSVPHWFLSLKSRHAADGDPYPFQTSSPQFSGYPDCKRFVCKFGSILWLWFCWPFHVPPRRTPGPSATTTFKRFTSIRPIES